MIVERRTYLVKIGHDAEAVAILKRMFEISTFYTNPYRIYTCYIGPNNVIVVEWEWEDLEQMGAVWAAVVANPEFAPLQEQWRALRERGGQGELWHLAAQRPAS